METFTWSILSMNGEWTGGSEPTYMFPGSRIGCPSRFMDTARVPMRIWKSARAVIPNPIRLREEQSFQLGCGRNPVPRADHHGRGVQIIEAKLRQIRGDGVQDGAALHRVAGENHLAGFTNGFHQGIVVQRSRAAK